MSDIREGEFWINLARKIIKQIAKSLGVRTRAKTHHQHVVPHDDGWAIKGEGNKKYTDIFERQSEAIERARDIAINYGSDVIIHGRDGAIRDRMSYRK